MTSTEQRPLMVTNDEAELLLLAPQFGHVHALGTERRWPQWARTLGHVALGQLLSLLVCASGVFSKQLAQAGIVAPTAQSFATYAMLGLFWSAMVWIRPTPSDPQAAGTAAPAAATHVREWRWKSVAWLVLIAAADVEANYIVIKAYSLTTFTSVQLMGCASLPLAMALSERYLGRRYSALHCLAVVGCVAGLGLLVLSDTNAESSVGAPAPLIGDLLCFASGSLYAICNVGQEAVLTPAKQARGRLAAAQAKGTDFARATRLQNSVWLALLGVFGSSICAIQILLLERGELSALFEELRSGRQDIGRVATQAGGFGLAMFSFYSLAPRLLAARGAVFFNLSLLSTNFWAVVVGRVVFGERQMAAAVGEDPPSGSVSLSYPVGFVLIMLAVTLFNVAPETDRPESGRFRLLRSQVRENGNETSKLQRVNDSDQESHPLRA